MIAEALCAASVKLTPADYLQEAHSICKRVPTVWFVASARFDPVTRTQSTVYRIFRRGMGLVAERTSPAALVAYLRKQLPPASLTMSADNRAAKFAGRSFDELAAEFPDDEVVIYRNYAIRCEGFPDGAECLILIPKATLEALKAAGKPTPLAGHGSVMVRK